MVPANLPASNCQVKDYSEELDELFGPPPLLEGEDLGAFQSLKRRLFESVKPEDFIEAMSVNDLLHLIWESMRLRKQRAKLLTASEHVGLRDLIGPLAGSFSIPNDLTREWRLNGRKASGELADIMKQAKIDREQIQAQTLASKLETYEAIDRMIERADARRIVIMRELDRHRETLARRIQVAVTQIEDAEFEDIAPGVQEAAE